MLIVCRSRPLWFCNSARKTCRSPHLSNLELSTLHKYDVYIMNVTFNGCTNGGKSCEWSAVFHSLTRMALYKRTYWSFTGPLAPPTARPMLSYKHPLVSWNTRLHTFRTAPHWLTSYNHLVHIIEVSDTLLNKL